MQDGPHHANRTLSRTHNVRSHWLGCPCKPYSQDPAMRIGRKTCVGLCAWQVGGGRFKLLIGNKVVMSALLACLGDKVERALRIRAARAGVAQRRSPEARCRYANFPLISCITYRQSGGQAGQQPEASPGLPAHRQSCRPIESTAAAAVKEEGHCCGGVVDARAGSAGPNVGHGR